MTSNHYESLYVEDPYAEFIIDIIISVHYTRQITGSPWDWQSGNAKYPTYSGAILGIKGYDERNNLPHGVAISGPRLNVTAEVGHPGVLPCLVKNLGEYNTVSLCHISQKN